MVVDIFRRTCGNNLLLGMITHFTLEAPPKPGPAADTEGSVDQALETLREQGLCSETIEFCSCICLFVLGATGIAPQAVKWSEAAALQMH